MPAEIDPARCTCPPGLPAPAFLDDGRCERCGLPPEGTQAPAALSERQVRQAVRAVLRSGEGARLVDALVEEDDVVWAEDAFIDLVIDRARKAAT